MNNNKNNKDKIEKYGYDPKKHIIIYKNPIDENISDKFRKDVDCSFIYVDSIYICGKIHLIAYIDKNKNINIEDYIKPKFIKNSSKTFYEYFGESSFLLSFDEYVA